MSKGGRPQESLVDGCPHDDLACKAYAMWTRETAYKPQERRNFQAELLKPRQPDHKTWVRVNKK